MSKINLTSMEQSWKVKCQNNRQWRDFEVHDDILEICFVTNMLIVCTQLLIYEKRKKGEYLYSMASLSLMYREQKAVEKYAETTASAILP